MANDPISYARTTQVRLRRGTTAQIAANPPIEAEPFYDLTEKRIGVGGTTEIIEQWKSQFLEHTADATDAVARNLQEKLTEIVSVKDFGAVGDGVTDDTEAVKAAFAAREGMVLYGVPGATYLVSESITNNCYFIGNGCTFNFSAPTIQYLFQQNQMGGFYNATINGSGVASCVAGYFVDCDFTFTNFCNYKIIIKNISNSNNTQACSGFLAVLESSATNSDIKMNIEAYVDGVVATSNGVVGDEGGKASGVLVSANKAATTGQVAISGKINNISSGGSNPSEDADGVHVFSTGFASSLSLGLFTINNCVVTAARKRGFKIQAPNTVVSNSICYGQTTLAGFETYAINTTFRSCSYLLGTGSGITTEAADTIIDGCYVDSSSTSGNLIVLYNNSDRCRVSNTIASSTGTLSSGSVGVVNIKDADDVLMNGVIITNTQTSGCGIALDGAASVRFSNGKVSGATSGLNFLDSTGMFFVSSSDISGSSHAVFRSGNGSQSLYASDTRFEATGSTVLNCWNSAGANSMYSEIVNCVISTGGGGGAWVPSDSKFSGNRVENLGTLGGIGVYLSGSNCISQNNQFTNFSTGILGSYTSNQILSGNLTVGCTTPYDTTGASPLLNVDNVSR